jgi:predicted Zn-dependent peptidase
MSNIREDKGYTYGIYSGMTHLDEASYFYISTEVGSHVCQPAIGEVYAEMQRLRQEPVSEEELDLVRNYLLGTILGSIDGPFRSADTVRGILQGGLPMDYVQHLVDTIRTVTPVQLQALANRYLQPDDLLELVVGWPEEATVLGANGVGG